MRSVIIGSYVLALWLERSQAICVGQLGRVGFPAGWYLYSGSALGPGGLRRRVARHRRQLGTDKRLFWHVDCLREQAAWGGAWGRASAQHLECAWLGQLRTLCGAEVAAPGFGASDCHCPAHLVRVPALPQDDWFTSTLGAERIWMEGDKLDELLSALVTANDERREAVALALGQLGCAAVPPLAALLATGGADVRWWAARALAEVGGEASLAPLLNALADGDADVRACACLALGRIGLGSAAPALATHLADESAFVADLAADALRMIGEPAIASLSEVLAHPDPHARSLAVRALARMRAQGAIGPLCGALEDPSYLVRYYAQEALDALGVGMVYFAS